MSLASANNLVQLSDILASGATSVSFFKFDANQTTPVQVPIANFVAGQSVVVWSPTGQVDAQEAPIVITALNAGASVGITIASQANNTAKYVGMCFTAKVAP